MLLKEPNFASAVGTGRNIHGTLAESHGAHPVLARGS
jgi:hypothetical protein